MAHKAIWCFCKSALLDTTIILQPKSPRTVNASDLVNKLLWAATMQFSVRPALALCMTRHVSSCLCYECNGKEIGQISYALGRFICFSDLRWLRSGFSWCELQNLEEKEGLVNWLYFLWFLSATLKQETFWGHGAVNCFSPHLFYYFLYFQ